MATKKATKCLYFSNQSNHSNHSNRVSGHFVIISSGWSLLFLRDQIGNHKVTTWREKYARFIEKCTYVKVIKILRIEVNPGSCR